ncbi:MAG: hypothetical protein ACM3KR_10820 [Deltaproteobacteria bacterium]
MYLQEIIDYLSKVCEENGQLTSEDVIKLTEELGHIVKLQNESLLEIKNANIRIENKIKYIENEVEKSRVYKNIVDTMLQKINKSPVKALLYFYKIKKNLEKLINE